MHQYPDYVKEGSRYVSTGRGLRIEWQQGPFLLNGPNGSMPEQPVRALIHRIEALHAERPCPQNPQILMHLNAVLGLMDERTRDRNSRGVIGSEAV